MKSPKFESYKEQYQKNWITKDTLKLWVAMQPMLPALGITAAEYQEITGEEYAQ